MTVALFGFALSLRPAAPHDGLFFDDAWQTFGAAKGTLGQLYVVGQSQPGFTAALFLWSRLFGDAPATMVIPARIAGALGPPALYLVLRRFRYARSIALLMGAILCVSTAHISNSSRVKSYTTDVLVTLLMALVVDRLCDRTWNRRIAGFWIVIAVVVATAGAIAPLLVVAAGIIFVLHPRGDLRLRVVAVGGQIAATAIYVLAVTRTYNQIFERRALAREQGFIGMTMNPFRLGDQIFRHLVRVMQTYPGGPQPWPYVLLVVAAVGLAVACWRGRMAIVSRFLVLATVLAIGGSVARRVPFGPLEPSLFGRRLSLWLIPVIAIGIAESLQQLRRKARHRPAGEHLFGVLMTLLAVCVLISGVGVAHPYSASGGRAATQFVMAHLGSRDAVWVTRTMTYSFALSAGVPVRVRAAPHEEVGFVAAFADSRLNMLTGEETQQQLSNSVQRANRVWVLLPPKRNTVLKYQRMLEASLRRYGFVLTGFVNIHACFVERWDRKSA